MAFKFTLIEYISLWVKTKENERKKQQEVHK